MRSASGGDETAGFTTWRGTRWTGVAGPFQSWMLTRKSNHLWRASLPQALLPGVHTLHVETESGRCVGMQTIANLKQRFLLRCENHLSWYR